RDIAPGNNEDRVAGVHGVAHERVIGPKIENVILVDAGRYDDQRPTVDLRGGRCVLDELDQIVLQDHPTRRHREVSSDLERAFVGDRDAAALQVAEEVCHAFGDAGTVRLYREGERLRVCGQEIRRRDRIRILAGEKADPSLRGGVALGQLGELAQVLCVKL